MVVVVCSSRLPDRLVEIMARSRKPLIFPEFARLHAPTNDLEVAQQRWIQKHADRLRTLSRLSGHSGLERVALGGRSDEPNGRDASFGVKPGAKESAGYNS